MPNGRHALKTPPHHTTWPELRETWVAADQMGVFESLWNWDHFYPLAEPYDGPNLEGWTMLAALADATSNVRVGAMVNGMHHRHPAVTANAAATLDHIAEGRFDLGMGAGWNEMESNAYGIELGTLKQRFDRFDEGMDVIVSLLKNKSTTYSGEYYQLTDAWCEPKPLQDRIPIVIGGKGKRRTLRTVAKHADQWDMTFPDSPEFWLEHDEVLRSHCADIGRDPSEITRSVHISLTDEDPNKLVSDVQPFFDAGVDVVVWSWRGPLDIGRLEKLAAAIG